ncbi:hypothetical protein ACFYTQ_16785 [Nocardia sp. NPDC004068]|uniref:hypothetical protein n=1 Tax=Nocardia sp. NPDC004068 TaxID=3364303 RepID=UPI00368E6DC6
MTVDFREWERILRRELAEIEQRGEGFRKVLGAVRGRAEFRGVLVEVDATGDITDMRLAPGVMRWHSAQLADVIRDCHRRARADAKSRVEQVVERADPRLRGPLRELIGRREPAKDGRPRRALTEEEIQAADDEYFRWRNRSGWLE